MFAKNLKPQKPFSLHLCNHILTLLESEHEGHFQKTENEFVPIRLLNKISNGAFGSVYECCICCSSFRMAAKVIRKTQEVDPLSICQEVAISRLLNHKGIVQFYDLREFPDHYVLLMEYVHGCDLLTWVEKQKEFYFETKKLNRYPIESFRERIYILKEVLDAIIYLWSQKIVHRDLKLENVLYGQNKVVKICDFGLATFVPYPDHVLTDPCGSAHYLSPEVIQCKYYGESSTVWSFGILMYSLFFGKYPFDEKTLSVICEMIQKGKYHVPNLGEFFDGLSRDGQCNWMVKDLFQRIFCLDVSQRISLEELQSHPFFVIASASALLPIPIAMFRAERKKKSEFRKYKTISRSKSMPSILSPCLASNRSNNADRQASWFQAKTVNQDSKLMQKLLLSIAVLFPQEQTFHIHVRTFPEHQLWQNLLKNYLIINHYLLCNTITNPSKRLCNCNYQSIDNHMNPNFLLSSPKIKTNHKNQNINTKNFLMRFIDQLLFVFK